MIDNAFVHACTHHTTHIVLILSLLVHAHSTTCNTCTCIHTWTVHDAVINVEFE